MGASLLMPKPESSLTELDRSDRLGSNPARDASGESYVAPKAYRNPLLPAFAFGLAALALFLLGIGQPERSTFDENFYVPAARAMLHGSLIMESGNPPLGKLLIAAGIKVAGDNPIGWRFPSAVCGALTLVAVFLWTHLLFGEYRISFLAAALTLLNNFLFVMSRIGMMDIFMVFFVFWSLVTYTAALKLDLSAVKRRMLLCCSGFLLGLAGACKWNAVDTLAVFVSASFAAPWISKHLPALPTSSLARFAQSLRQVGAPCLFFGLIVLPVVSYSLVFWVLFRSVHIPFGIPQLLKMNYAMWHQHLGDTTAKAVALAWYRWPFQTSPMRILSYLLGNPVVMWGGAAGIAFCLWRSWKSFGFSEGLVVLLYAANLLQWAFTPTRAFSLYYYYFPAAMFLGVAMAVMLNSLPRTFLGMRIGMIVLVAASLIFLWCYPRMAHLDAPWDCALGCWD
jgi:dolichyl-phosphate-mannose-protein mannosyltransferase